MRYIIYANVCLLMFQRLVISLEETWFKGCFKKTTDLLGDSDRQPVDDIQDWNEIIVDCAKRCNESSSFMFISVEEPCRCLDKVPDEGNQVDEADCRASEQISTNVSLPLGRKKFVAIYSTKGPYIDHLILTVDQSWVVVNTETSLEIAIKISKLINITDTIQELKPVHIIIQKESSQDRLSNQFGVDSCGNYSAPIGDQIYTVEPVEDLIHWKVPLVFDIAGNQSIKVYVSNELSTLQTELVIAVHQPEPKDLQVVIQADDPSRPSCIPESFPLSENVSYFSVFVDAEFTVVASVAHGNNLTFELATEAEDGLVEQWWTKPCDHECVEMIGSDGCRRMNKMMAVGKSGIYSIMVTVKNQFGSLSQNIYLVAIEYGLDDLSISAASGSAVQPGEPVQFSVSMEIRSRSTTHFKVNFYEDHSHNGTFEDSNSTSLSINCPQGEMTIIASYGDTCQLELEFEHSFEDEGLFVPEIYVTDEKNTSLNARLETPLTVVSQLQGARLHANRFVPVNQTTEIVLYLAVQSISMNMSWEVFNDEGDKISTASWSSSDPYLHISFSNTGLYNVLCTASNIMGSIQARTSLKVEESVSDLQISCDTKNAIRTNHIFSCLASILRGTDVSFDWLIFSDFFKIPPTSINSNMTSTATLTFDHPGIYNVSVIASNGVSRLVKYLENLVTVQNPITYVILQQKEPNVAGEMSELKITTSQTSNVDVDFEFDFGWGRESYNYTYEVSNNAYYLDYVYHEAGVYDVTVYAYNLVSNVSSSIDVIVEQAIERLEIKLERVPAIGIPAVFILKIDGDILSQSDLIFSWEFSDGDDLVSASPIVSKMFSSLGSHSINFTARNLVSEYKKNLQVKVGEQLPTQYTLLHDSIVAVHKPVQFLLKGDLSTVDLVDVNYGDNFYQAIDSLENQGWSHVYTASGIYTIQVNFTGEDGGQELIESRINVQEPVAGLKIRGPHVVEIKGLNIKHEWEAVTETGTNLFYIWNMDGEDTHTTHNKYYKGFPLPGEYILGVTAVNDISQESTSITVTALYPIVDLQLVMQPAIMGKPSLLSMLVTGGQTFDISVRFGDGQSETFSSDEVSITTINPPDRGIPKYNVILNHVYNSVGEFVITVNVSNLLSSRQAKHDVTVHEPIDGITMTTSSTEFVPVGEKVSVTATVASGKNLQFEWDFSDSYSSTVVSHENTSTATHTFEYSRDYEVQVKVTNHLYKEPVVARLPFQFKAVEMIEDVKIMVDGDSTSLVLMGTRPDWKTADIVFQAFCSSGSHMTFVYFFGDGKTASTEGHVIQFLDVVTSKARHRYTKEGVYKVHVTAINPLGNVTAYLKDPVIVHRPPLIHKLKERYFIPYGQKYLFKVEQVDDSNVTFDWKFGDQTEVVNSNSTEISHFYQKAGVYDLVVVARDQGTITNTTAKVFVEHKIQGVNINVDTTNKMKLVLSAQVFPEYANLVNSYRWKFYSRGREWTKVTKENYYIHSDFMERYTLTVQVSNNISSAESSILKLPAKIESLQIKELSGSLTNQTTRFKALAFRGSEMTLTWNFGDGTPNVVQDANTLYIDHVYTKEGVYNVTLLATNLISQATDSKIWFVTDKECLPPDISIFDSTLKKINRSEIIEYAVEVTSPVKCEGTVPVLLYSWMLTDRSNKELIRTAKNKRFIIPPCTLNPGLYNLKVKVQIQNSIVFSKKDLELEVLLSPVVATIKGGTVREITRLDTVIMDGSLSTSRGCPISNDLRFEWNCSRKFVPTEESCFNPNITSNLTLNETTISFPAEYFAPDLEEAVFTLKVWQGDKVTSSAVQVLQVNNQDEPFMLSIHCPQCDQHRINPNEPLLLHAVCSNCPEETTEYEWKSQFVFQRYYPRRIPVVCIVKQLDGSSFRLMVADNSSYTDMAVPESKNDSKEENGTKSSEENGNQGKDTRKRRQTSDYDMMDTPMPQVGEGRYFSSRKSSRGGRGRSRHRDYSGSQGTISYFGGLVEVTQGSSNNRQDTIDRQVAPGISEEKTDKVYDEKREKPAKKLHILEKSLRRAYLPDHSTTTGTNKQSLIIKPDYFRQGFEYIIQVQAKSKDGAVRGTAMTSFSINSSPSKGECEIYPHSGVELITEFRLYCKAWQDEDKPLQYEVSFRFNEQDTRYVLYRGLNHGVNFTLPAGEAKNNYSVTVYISVLDGRQARTFVCTHLTRVTPISLHPGTTLRDIILGTNNPVGKLTAAKRRGDGHRIKSVILALSRCLHRLVTMETKVKLEITDFIPRMVKELHHLSIRNELEVLQTVQALDALVLLRHEFKMDDYEKIISLVDKISIKMKEILSPTLDKNIYVLINRVLARLIETLSLQDDLVHAWLQQTFNTKPVNSKFEMQNNNSLNFSQENTVLNDLGADASSMESEGQSSPFPPSIDGSQPKEPNTESSTFPTAIFNSSQLGVGMDNSTVQDSTLDAYNPVLATRGETELDTSDDLAHEQKHRDQIKKIYRGYLETVLKVHHSILQNEMTYHTQSEGELLKSSEYIVTKAAKYRLNDSPVLEINQSKIVLPENMGVLLKDGEGEGHSQDVFLPNHNCFQVHMTKFNFNPYVYNDQDETLVQPEVCSLRVLSCAGNLFEVRNLSNENMVQFELPRQQDQIEIIAQHQLDKSKMNIHSFNVTRGNRNNSMNLEIDLVPVTQGRLFTITVLLNYNSPPTPSQYIKRADIHREHLKIFFPSGYLNYTGEYFIGILDADLNKGRHREGEVTQRNYTLKLWWNKCLFWNETNTQWSDNGCWATDRSTYYKTHCRCNHMTTYGSHFELVPNDLSQLSIEEFFDLNENPVTLVLTGVIALVYVLLMFLCHRFDQHDSRKVGLTYLIDNKMSDKQKYEVTIETGFRRGAGTTAKISLILHGKDGMSETRELISEEDRPLFERNSRDKFILTLPDSIGKIMRVQLWHNNHGKSPSWYLSRVIVKDLNIGSTYYFISEKWLAVEEEDGKVEREFTAIEGDLGFRKVFWAKGTQYFMDYHLWLSLFTCPSYSYFTRKQRLTLCVTLLLMYMCLNAMWYKQTPSEYRGEFGLLDVSLRNIVVGALCCAIVIPVYFLLLLFFRRSKSQQSRDYIPPILDEEKDSEQFPSGKPDEDDNGDDEEEMDLIQPIMTYSLLDQSILNWPSIQDWAQKQWVKRHQGYQETPSSPEIPHNQIIQRRRSEIDQASSGFEDSNSTDPRRQVYISSLNSSQKIKQSSISSGAGQKTSSCCSSKPFSKKIFLPCWCQYIAWFLCASISVTCAVITIMYGYRFGVAKSMMWLQSLYFSFMVCVFITQPFMIIIAVIYTAIRYRDDLSVLDHYEEGEFGEKAKMEILRRKKEQIQYSEQEEFERGVAARQRSRYLRFARPPQEKQLIEARKKIMKEKESLSLLRDLFSISLMFALLCIVAYGKDTSSPYYINNALKNSIIRSGPVKYENIKFRYQWYDWFQSTMVDVVFPSNNNQSTEFLENSYMIGQVQLRQVKVTKSDCYSPQNLPFIADVCFHDYQTSNQMKGNKSHDFKEATSSFSVFGRHGIYDDSGYVIMLNKSRNEVFEQLVNLQHSDWIDNQTRAIFVEFTLYNTPTNLFTSVVLLLEISASGAVNPDHRIRSTHLYRYVTKWDNAVLAAELLFIILTVYKIGLHLCELLRTPKYFQNIWICLDVISCLVSVLYIGFYIYRFVLVSETVERLRSTYFTQFVDVSALTFWDDIIRCFLGIILFLIIIKFIKLLHYSGMFSKYSRVKRRIQKEFIAFMVLFFGTTFVFSTIGQVLFGTILYGFSDFYHSLFSVAALFTGIYEDYPIPDSSVVYTLRIFVIFVAVFTSGFLTSYMLAILSYRLRTQKHKHSAHFVMDPKDTILFYWKTFLFWTGILPGTEDEEPDYVLPPEFTMAEVKYQVDELFFRINTLTGSHGLPEKPMSYFTDSDGTYGLGDDGISSGGSEVNLEDEVLIEYPDNFNGDSCFHDLYINQLLRQKDQLSKYHDKQIRSPLEMEIVKQLQSQTASVNVGGSSKSSVTTSVSSSEMTTPFGDRKLVQGASSSAAGAQNEGNNISTLVDDFHKHDISSSSSSPDSPDQQLKNTDTVKLLKTNQRNKDETVFHDLVKLPKSSKKLEPPSKPTFQNPGLRDKQTQEIQKSSVLNSPALRQLRSSLQALEHERLKAESNTTESSSGSEQDAIHGGPIKRNLRKTKSRGKGKGAVNLTSILLDDLDTSNDELGAAMGASYKMTETEPILEQEIMDDY